MRYKLPFFCIRTALLFFLASIVFSSAMAASVSQYLSDAEKAMGDKSYRTAIVHLKNALQQEPDNQKGRLLLGRVYLSIGDPVSAEKELRRARSLGAPEEELFPYLADVYLSLGRPDDLLSEIKDRENFKAETRATISALRGDAYLLQGKRSEAEKQYQTALKHYERSSMAHVGFARIALGNKNSTKAAAEIEKAIEFDPSNVNAWLLKAQVTKIGGDVKGAEQAYREALKSEPDNVNAKLGIVSILVAEKDAAGAKKYIDEIKKYYPTHPVANYFSALISFENGKIDEARSILEDVTGRYKDHLPSLLLLANILYQKNDIEQASEVLRRFNNLQPNYLPAAKLYGVVLLKQQRYTDAIKVLSPWEKQETTDSQFLTILGSAYLRNGDSVKGTKLMEQAVEQSPQLPAAQVELALGYLASGKIDQAISTLETASELDADVTQADVVLIVTLLRNEKFEEALTAADAFVKKRPKDPVAYNFRAAVHLSKKNTAAAKKDFGQAIELDGKFTPARINLGRVAYDEGNMDGARQQYEAVLAYDSSNEKALLGMAQIAAARNDSKDIKKWLKRSQDSNPESVTSAVAMARFYLTTNEPLNALDVLRIPAEKAPNHPLLVETQALAYFQNRDYRGAVERYSYLRDRYPQMVTAWIGVARSYLADNRSKDAIKELEKADAKFEGNIAVRVLLGNILLSQKQYQQADALAKKIKTTNKDSAVGWLLAGDVAVATARYEDAVKEYSAARKIEESSIVVRKLANAYSKANASPKGIALLESWLGKNAGDADSLMMLAMELQASGEADKAIAKYEAFIKLQPNNVAALNNLAWLYSEKRDRKAIVIGKQAFDLAKGNPSVADTYGWALLKTGDSKQALNILRQASSAAPHMHEIRLHLVEALIQNNNKSEAKSELDRLSKGELSADLRKQADALQKQL